MEVDSCYRCQNNSSFIKKCDWNITETNKILGEPNHSNGAENCVEMYRSESHNGRWNDARCEDPKPYYCSKPQDPDITVGSEINSNRNCKSGWLQVR